MSFDLNIPVTQAIALMNLSARDGSGVPSYTTDLGDTSYSLDEIERSAQSGVTQIMEAICDTDGHFHRPLFQASTALTHGAILPSHRGSIGVPRITPYLGCTYTLNGKRKSIEEIAAYRANPDKLYSTTNHNVVNGQFPSKLAGFYAIEATSNVFYFTGYSAVADLADFDEDDYISLPDSYYPLAINLTIAGLRKDGDVSDIFSYYASAGAAGLGAIMGNGATQPSAKVTLGTRDTGAK